MGLVIIFKRNYQILLILQIDDDLFSPFLAQPKPGENSDDLFNLFAQTQQSQLSACQYLTQYSRAVNENIWSSI